MTKRIIKSEEDKNQTLMGQLLTSHKDSLLFPAVGDTVTGKVIFASNREAKIDIDGIGVGVVRGKEVYLESPEYADLKEGDEVEATVVELENENGELELSFRSAGHKKVWDNLNKLREDGTIVEAEILDANKGGLMVKVNKIAGFLPVSQLSSEHYPRVPGGDKNKIFERLKSYAGKKFDVKVITAEPEEEKLIVSEKAAWEESHRSTISKYQVGDEIEGKVTAVTDFGAFLNFGENLEGLIHISELAWQRIDDPRDIIKAGQTVKAKIINIDGSKIFLSIKALQKDPWENINERYQIGQIVPGKVIKTNPFGLFVELDQDIHGLAHISELSDKPVDDISKIAKPGDTLKFKIVSIEPKDHRLGLSIKALKEKNETGEAAEDVKEEKSAKKLAKKAKKEKEEPAEEIKE